MDRFWLRQPVGARIARSIVLALGLLWSARLGAASLTASLQPDTIALGESALLTLTFEDGEPANTPAIPAVGNLRITFQGNEQRVSFVNGVGSRTFAVKYVVSPLQPGDYTIPPVSARIGQQVLRSPALKLKVTKSGETAPGGSEQDRHAFLKLILPKTEAFVGEVLPVETRLYIVEGQINQMPTLTAEGFTLGKTMQLPQNRVQLGGIVYRTIGIKTTAIPTKAGNLVLGPAEWSLSLKIAPNRGRSRDPFEDFFGPRYELRPVKLASEPVNIQVHPLPAQNKPADFTGGIGDFSVEVNVSPTNVAVGDPITLKIRVTGRGALDNIALPSLAHWREFRAYPPTSKVETTDPLGTEGVKTFDQVVVPQNTEVRELPALSLSFFNPATKAYRTITRPPTPLVVRPSGMVQAIATVATNQAPGESATPPQQDLVPLKARLGVVSAIQPPLIYQRWFLALQGAPLLAWVLALLWRRRQEHLANNPRLVRRQSVSRRVRNGLTELRALASANDSQAFFGLVFRLLQEQLGERLNLPAAAITEAVVEEQLQPRGVAAPTLTALAELFQACNQAKYAPVRSSQQLMALLPQVEAALKDVAQLDL